MKRRNNQGAVSHAFIGWQPEELHPDHEKAGGMIADTGTCFHCTYRGFVANSTIGAPLKSVDFQ